MNMGISSMKGKRDDRMYKLIAPDKKFPKKS